MSSVASKYTDSNDFNYEEINQILGELEKKGEAFLDRLGVSSETSEFEFYTSARYPMQVTELEVPLGDKVMTPERCAKLIEIFHDAHLARYKTADPGSPLEFVMWRSVARSRTPGISLFFWCEKPNSYYLN